MTMTHPDAQPDAQPDQSPSTGVKALRALRATRKRNRLGDIEWFDAAYKVYIVALFGGFALAWLSDLVGDETLTANQAVSVERQAPAVLGMVAVLAVAAGLRSGSQGGPLALEGADVTVVMMSPVPRRAALLKPAIQRIRGGAFAGGIAGAVLGQLAGRRLPGTPVAWFAASGLFGVQLAFLWIGAALIAHALRVRLWIATAITAAAIAWQAAAIATDVPGLADANGSLALWGWRQHGIDLAAVGIAVAMVVIGVVLIARTSLEALARRSSLVAQLRFAVTMQDLRTVVLLRRQLAHEQTRSDPWIRLRPGRAAHPTWRRGWHSLLRFPTSRLVRMGALAIGAAACQVAVVHGTTPALFGTAALTFVLGMEVLEPLSQEIDQPDRTDSFPVERGMLMARHLIAPAIALVPFAVLAAAAAVIIDAAASDEPRVGAAAAVAAILAVPTMLAGAAGAAVSVVRDAPDPMAATSQQTFMPPEMAGMSTMLRTLVPLAVSSLGALSVLFVVDAVDPQFGTPTAGEAVGAALRGAVMLMLLIAAIGVWVRHRDRLRRAVRNFMDQGRVHTQQQRSNR